MSSSEGGRKISGEEKNLANAQASLLNKQGSNLDSLQRILSGLGSGELAQLGLNSAGGILQAGQLPAAPTAVANPGARPVSYRSVYTGKNWGKNDQAKQAASEAAQKAWDQKNAQYQQYLQQKAAYDQQVQQIQANPDAYYLQDPKIGQQKEDSLVNQILGGQLTAADAQAQGISGGQAAGRAGFMQLMNQYLDPNNPDYQAANQVLSQYNQRLAGNVPEASQLQGFLDRISTGLAGNTYINPQLTREMQDAEASTRTRLFQQLGSGYENSSAGIEALNALQRTKLGTIDELNRTDLNSAVSNYTGLSSLVDSKTANLLNQYLGLNQDRLNNLNAGYTGYTGLTDFSQSNRQQAYQNDLGNRLQRVGVAQGIATQPYQVDYTSLINAYTGANQAATQRQSAGAATGGGWQGALGKIAGTVVGGVGGYFVGGPAGAFAGASLGSQLGGGAAGGGATYNLYN